MKINNIYTCAACFQAHMNLETLIEGGTGREFFICPNTQQKIYTFVEYIKPDVGGREEGSKA